MNLIKKILLRMRKKVKLKCNWCGWEGEYYPKSKNEIRKFSGLSFGRKKTTSSQVVCEGCNRLIPHKNIIK